MSKRKSCAMPDFVGTLSVLDDWDALSRRVKEAFEFHPWVAIGAAHHPAAAELAG